MICFFSNNDFHVKKTMFSLKNNEKSSRELDKPNFYRFSSTSIDSYSNVNNSIEIETQCENSINSVQNCFFFVLM